MRSSELEEPVRVLVVDDEPAIRHAVEAVLLDEGFFVTTVSNGAAALTAAETVQPDAILLDLRMPVMDGYAFLAAYRKRPEPRAAVIVCSTSAKVAGTVDLGATAYLRKPFDIDELISVIYRLTVARRQSTGEIVSGSAVHRMPMRLGKTL